MYFRPLTTATGILILCITYVCTQTNELGGFIPPGYEEVTSKSPGGGFGAIEKCGEGSTRGVKMCVPYYQCDGETKMIILDGNTDGAGIIEIRFGEETPCEHYLDICCGIPKDGVPTSKPDVEQPPSEDPPSDRAPEDPKPEDPRPEDPKPEDPKPKPEPSWTCGVRNDNGVGFRITDEDNESQYGEFPWMTALVKSNYKPPNDNLLVCGGSLIAPNIVLTAAHCVQKYNTSDLRIRVGEWDTQTQKEFFPYQEREIERIIIHEDYNPKVLFNDVALLVLAAPVEESNVVGTICLPQQGQVFDSKNCVATGWGKHRFGREGAYSAIMKKVQLPVVPNMECQEKLRRTRLGKFFILDNSFICAGGQEGLDTCTGDGGSPLVCPDPNQPHRYIQAGIVAWGIGCGGADTPAVYVNVGQFRNWIDGKMISLEGGYN